MKIVALMGSPRKGSNTDTLVDKVLEGARDAGAETKKFRVWDLDVSPCKGCMSCRQTGVCKHYNDDIAKLARELGEADGWVLGAPVWGGFIPGQLKMVFDRLVGAVLSIQPSAEGVQVTSRLPQKKRNGVSIAVCASPAREMTDATIIFLNHNLQLHGNGGEIREIRAPGLGAYGQVKMDSQELEKVLEAMGVDNAGLVAVQGEKINRDLLDKAYEVGEKMVSSLT